MAVNTAFPPPHVLHDDALIMKAAGLIAASAAVATIIDLGPGTGYRIVRVEALITALEIASNDEFYSIWVQFANSATFATDTLIFDACCIEVGAKEIKRTDSDRDDATGVRSIMVENKDEVGGLYRYMRLYTVVAGTIAGGGGINYSARASFVHQQA